MDSPPPVERKNTFGILASLSPELEQGDFRVCTAPLSSKPEDEYGKHTLYYMA